MNTPRLSIRQKIALYGTVIAALVAVLTGGMSAWHASSVIESRALHSELPAKVMQIRNAIDGEITTLKAISEQLATNVISSTGSVRIPAITNSN